MEAISKDFRLHTYGGGGVLSFQFPMVDSANRPAYKTGLTITASLERIEDSGLITTMIVPTSTITEIGTTGRYRFYMVHYADGNTTDPSDEELTITFSAAGADTQCIKIVNDHGGLYNKNLQAASNAVTTISGTIEDTKTLYGSNFLVEALPSEPSYISMTFGLAFDETPVAFQIVARAPKTTTGGSSNYWWRVKPYNMYPEQVNDTPANEQDKIYVYEPGDADTFNYLIIPMNNTHKNAYGAVLITIDSSTVLTTEYRLEISYMKLIVEKNGKTISHSMTYSDLRSSAEGLKVTKSAVDTIDTIVDTINANIGTPVALSGGAATLASNLVKMADNASGLDFNSATDSLALLQGAIVEGVPENEIAVSATVTSGVVVSGAYTDTHTKNDVYLRIRPDGTSVFDFYLEFQIETKVPQSVYINGKTTVIGGATAATNVYAYNWVTLAWQQISGVSTQIIESATDLNFTYQLTSQHRENSATGRVRIAFRSIRNNVADIVDLDQILVRAVATGLTAAEISDTVWLQGNQVYYGAKIYVDTVHGVAGSVVGENGTPINPVNNLADAKILLALCKFKHLHIDARSALTLDSGLDEIDVGGYAYTLTLNGQDIGNSRINGARLIGTAISTDLAPVKIDECHFSDQGVTLPSFRLFRCSFGGEITGYADSQYIAHSCYSGVAGTDTPIFNFGANSTLELRQYSGGMRIKSMVAGCRMSMEGNGQLIIDATCTGGTVAIRGNFTVTDYSGGAVTLSDNARFAVDQLQDELADIESAVVGAIPELTTGTPVSTPTLKSAMMLLYMALRNENVQTLDLRSISNDANSPIAYADTTDYGNSLVISKLYNPEA